jgi:thiamine-phosphate pyrophosphorylase
MTQGLYGITPQSLLADDRQLLEAVEAALAGGMRRLQYRAKTLSQTDRLRQARALRRLCHDHGARLIVNDDVDLAIAARADGVHLGREDDAIADARRRLGAEALIGASCYDRFELAQQALEQGADHVAFGRFFPSSTKPDAVQARPELLSRARRELDCPICAIGGITIDNGRALIAAGADCLAVIEGLFSASDIRQRALDFAGLWR